MMPLALSLAKTYNMYILNFLPESLRFVLRNWYHKINFTFHKKFTICLLQNKIRYGMIYWDSLFYPYTKNRTILKKPDNTTFQDLTNKNAVRKRSQNCIFIAKRRGFSPAFLLYFYFCKTVIVQLDITIWRFFQFHDRFIVLLYQFKETLVGRSKQRCKQQPLALVVFLAVNCTQ